MLLFIKFVEIQRGWNWLNFSGHIHLGREVGTYAFHFMGHFRSKVMDESLKYMSICMQRPFGGNLAMHLSIFEVRT